MWYNTYLPQNYVLESILCCSTTVHCRNLAHSTDFLHTCMCFLDAFSCSGVPTSYKKGHYFDKMLQPAEFQRKKKDVSEPKIKEHEQEHLKWTFLKTSWQGRAAMGEICLSNWHYALQSLSRSFQTRPKCSGRKCVWGGWIQQWCWKCNRHRKCLWTNEQSLK